MGLLQDRTAARRWYQAVSTVYRPVVGETFWPAGLQRRLLEWFDLDGSERVLDVGCGTGRTSRLVARRVGEVHAVDHSRHQLARATGDATYVRADAATLPYPDATFDAVVSVGAILYFPDPKATLAEARRVTRPGGRILVAGFNRPDPSPNPVENWATLANEALFCTYDRREARSLFREAGWTDVESRVTGPAWHPRLVLATTARN